jgi:hypothetical protein
MQNKDKTFLFISSGVSGGIDTDLVISTDKILGEKYNILKLQFADDPDFNDSSLIDYSKITLENIYSEFDKVVGNKKPKVYIGHSFSALLIIFYLLEREEFLRNTQKIVLLDPSDVKEIYPYLLSNQDDFTLDKSILDRLAKTSNPELIDSLKKKGVQVVQIDAENYGADHEFKDFEILKKVYRDLGLV